MYCIYCGVKLPAEARFCHSCGKAQPEKAMTMNCEKAAQEELICEIIYQTIGEKWGIFPRDIGEFQARLVSTDGIKDNDAADNIINKSPKIEIMSCSFKPDPKNKKHVKALEALVQELTNDGWVQQSQMGTEWYNLTLRKAIN